MNEKNTNRKTPQVSEDEMRTEYDFSNAVRGKYYKRYLESTNVVVLEPDVARRFKNSQSVNKALRSLMDTLGVSRPPARRSPRTRRQTTRR